MRKKKSKVSAKRALKYSIFYRLITTKCANLIKIECRNAQIMCNQGFTMRRDLKSD